MLASKLREKNFLYEGYVGVQESTGNLIYLYITASDKYEATNKSKVYVEFYTSPLHCWNEEAKLAYVKEHLYISKRPKVNSPGKYMSLNNALKGNECIAPLIAAEIKLSDVKDVHLSNIVGTNEYYTQLEHATMEQRCLLNRTEEKDFLTFTDSLHRLFKLAYVYNGCYLPDEQLDVLKNFIEEVELDKESIDSQFKETLLKLQERPLELINPSNKVSESIPSVDWEN